VTLGLIAATVNFAQAAKENGVKAVVHLSQRSANRHSPIAAADQGRAIAAILKKPDAYIGQTINLSGPVEMNHEQMAAELSVALGRKIVFQDLPIDEYCASMRLRDTCAKNIKKDYT